MSSAISYAIKSGSASAAKSTKYSEVADDETKIKKARDYGSVSFGFLFSILYVGVATNFYFNVTRVEDMTRDNCTAMHASTLEWNLQNFCDHVVTWKTCAILGMVVPGLLYMVLGLLAMYQLSNQKKEEGENESSGSQHSHWEQFWTKNSSYYATMSSAVSYAIKSGSVNVANNTKYSHVAGNERTVKKAQDAGSLTFGVLFSLVYIGVAVNYYVNLTHVEEITQYNCTMIIIPGGLYFFLGLITMGILAKDQVSGDMAYGRPKCPKLWTYYDFLSKVVNIAIFCVLWSSKAYATKFGNSNTSGLKTSAIIYMCIVGLEFGIILVFIALGLLCAFCGCAGLCCLFCCCNHDEVEDNNSRRGNRGGME
ncbi:unnamed protein product [Allacma fusca]|uniref:Uncharacterized protein n=1 Tax=Allacma fusca TaxID=39272 RepID=A0A8J2NXH7_9HEXA|nr:unnamed protein product [Allacma fusca]